MTTHELWAFDVSVTFIQYFAIFIFAVIMAIAAMINIKKVKANWADHRCNPLVMPFAGLFGYNTKENFEFCMGKVFSTHSSSYLGSFGTMFSQFTNLLQMIFDSIGSLRNTIASLGGGINVIFQEFTDRISNFFFKLRLSAIHIKSLISRMYAILFSVMYMGLSGITGMSSFTNTTLYSFLDTFCFPGETFINVEGKGEIQIKDIKIGDILLPTKSRVTATFRFYSKGQPMVKLGDTIVSTNHYVYYLGHPVKAGDHPEAKSLGSWISNEPLYCLNTNDNKIPLNDYVFLDYDETSDGDMVTMNFIEGRVNGEKTDTLDKEYEFTEYGAAIDETTKIKTKEGNKFAKDIKIGDKLVTGSEVVGLIRKEVNEICNVNNKLITPSTLYWNKASNKWERIGEIKPIISKRTELISFIVTPNSQIELENGLRIRDYMELCSPDSEIHYSKRLNHTKFE